MLAAPLPPQNKQKAGRNPVATGNQSTRSVFRPSFHFRAFAKIQEAEPSLTLDFLLSLARIPPSTLEAPLELWEWVPGRWTDAHAAALC